MTLKSGQWRRNRQTGELEWIDETQSDTEMRSLYERLRTEGLLSNDETFEQLRGQGFFGGEIKSVERVEEEQPLSDISVLERPTETPALDSQLRKIYPELFGETAETGRQQLSLKIEQDYKGFLDDLYQRVGADEAEKTLKVMGFTEDTILKSLDFKKQEQRITDLVKEIFPEFDSIDKFIQFASKNTDLFFETIQTGGSSLKKRQLLEAMGYVPEDINQILSVQRVVVPIKGVRKLVTVQNNKAFDEQGRWVGTYNPVTRQFEELPDETGGKDIWDAFKVGIKELQTVPGKFENLLGSVLFRDMTAVERKVFGDEHANRVNEFNRQMRAGYQKAYNKQVKKFEDWQFEHPELADTRQDETGFGPFLVGAARAAPPVIATQALAIVATALGHPALGAGISTGLFFPMQATGAYDDLVASGATPEQAGPLSLGISTVQSGIEFASNLLQLKTIAPSLYRLINKQITKELAGSALKAAAKRGIKTFTTVEVTEILEEITQDAVQNAVVKVYDKNRTLFKDIGKTIGITALLTAPLAGLGGAGEVVTRVPMTEFKQALREETGAIVPFEGGDVTSELIREGESLVNQAERLEPQNPDVVKFKEMLAKAKETQGKERLNALRGMEELEEKVRAVSGPTIESEVKQYQQMIADLTTEREASTDQAKIDDINKQIQYAETRIRDLSKAKPVTPEVTKELQTEYTRRMKPFLDKADVEIKKVNDEFMAGKTSLVENQAQRDAINDELDKQADKVRAEMGFPKPEAVTPTAPAAEPTTPIEEKPVIPEVTSPTLEYEVTVSGEQVIKTPKAGFGFKVENDFNKFQQLGGLAPRTEYDATNNRLIQEAVKGRFATEAELTQVRKLIEAKGLVPRGLVANDVIVTPEGNFRVVDVGNFEVVTPTAPAVEIPTAETGQPEAGLQPSMLPEEVAPAEVTEAEQSWNEFVENYYKNKGEAPKPTLPENITLPMPDNVTVSEDRIIRQPPPPKKPPPSEPPLTHPSQPAPIEAGRITMPNLQPAQQVIDLYSKPDLWRRVANLPLVKKAVGLFNPAAVANDPAKQALILRAVLKDEAAQKAQAVMSHLWEIGTQERVWGKTDEHGYLLAEQFAGFSIDDIRTNPSKFASEMTAQQKEWIKRASEIEKAKLDALRRNEVEINELSFEDGGEYAGRRVMGKFNDSGELIESGRISVGGRVGAKQAFEKTRVFKTAQEGIEAGYRYMNSDEALYYNTIGAYNKMADRQMAEWLLSKVDWRTTAAPEALVLQAEATHIRLRKAQQLQAALNRAVRGERVPSNTIDSIATVYSDQADTLRNLIPELQKPSPQTADIVQTLNNEANALIADAKLEYAQAVDKRARAREEAMRVKYEEASIAHPAFQGKIFTGAEAKEIADTLYRGLQPQFIEALGAVNKVNAIGRFFMLAGDVSPMTIQLQFLAFYRPVAYAKAMGGFVRAMFDPEFQYRYYARHRDIINRHPTLILSGRGTEFTEFMGRGGLGKKLGIVTKPLVPFQKAFEGCLDVAGIELAKSLDHLATTPENTLQVDQFINEFRGLTSSARIGVSSTHRQGETAWLLAPRYNRGIASYLFDIVHGGIRGHQARMSLAQGLAGLSAMAVAVSLALGEDDDEIWEHFDPRSPKFFTWDVFGVKIGLGGKVRSVLKMFGNMLKTGEVGQPALNFLRGNLSPGASTGLDLLTGKNYIGEPTRDNVLDFSKTIGRNFMMIWIQNLLLEGGTLKDKALIATAEFVGLRGYDISAKKELKIKDLEDRLGEVVGKTPILTKKKPDIYDTRNIYSDVKKILKNIPSEDILADAGYAGWGHLVAKIRDSEANLLPDIAFKDYNFDKSKGETLDDYIRQLDERKRIMEQGEQATYTRVKIVEGKEERTIFRGLEALTAHQSDYPNAQRGNLSKREIELLLEYNIAVDKKKFAEEHPEININRQLEWFKSHPKENAEFALIGQAKLLSKKAYTEFQGLLEDLDIPNSAVLPNSLPPEKSLDSYFKYLDMVSDNKETSWEAKLLIAKENDLREFLKLQPIETPTAALELKVKHRKLYDTRDSYSDKDSPQYIVDEKKRAEAIKKLKTDNPQWVDDTRRIEALETGTNEKPTDPLIVEAWVEYGKKSDERLGYDSETKVWLLDHKDIHKWALDNKLLTDDGKDWNEPVLRINVQYRKEDAEYNAIPEIDKRARTEYLAKNEAYRKDRRRREAYQLSNSKTGERFPESEIGNFVSYYELSVKGKRQERFLVDNPGFALAMHRTKGIDLPDPAKVPGVQYDDIYDRNKAQFDRLEGLSDFESEFYVEDGKLREHIRYRMLFDQNGKYTEFGVTKLRRDAYGMLIPEKHINDYVAYKQLIGEHRSIKGETWYEDDWFLMEHPEFYQKVYREILNNERRDFRKIPTRQVYRYYQQYLAMPSDERKAFREQHPDLEDWLILSGKTTTRTKDRLSQDLEDLLNKMGELRESRR